jgi:hypothetical protein
LIPSFTPMVVVRRERGSYRKSGELTRRHRYL